MSSKSSPALEPLLELCRGGCAEIPGGGAGWGCRTPLGTKGQREGTQLGAGSSWVQLWALLQS